MNGTTNPASFAYWYKLLVKNKMAGPGLSVAGLAIGFLLSNQLEQSQPHLMSMSALWGCASWTYPHYLFAR